MTFPEFLRAERARLGLSRAQLGEALDVSARTIESWETNDPNRQPMAVTKEGVIARIAKLRLKPKAA